MSKVPYLEQIERLGTALEMVAVHHHGQLDKAGKPILAHLLRVAARVAHLGPAAMTVALLHDVLEDTEVEVADLIKDFGFDIALQVELLTHMDGVPYDAYLRRIKERGGIALQVKLADNADNACQTRLETLPLATRERLAQKYSEARKILMEKTDV